MQPAELIQEHVRLIRVLTKGGKKEQQKEAKKQEKELLKMIEKVRNEPRK